MRPYRVIGLTCVLAFLTLLVLHGKAYYVGPIYPTLIAAGAVALGKLPRGLARAGVLAVIVLVVAWGALVLPFGLPVIPPAPMARYAAALGIKAATTTNRGTALPLLQDYADMLGWEDQVRAVARAYQSLPADRRVHAVLVASNYGQAGALEFLGPRHGLPRPVLMPGSALLQNIPRRLSSRPGNLLLETRAGRVAGVLVGGAVIRADHRLSEIAPEMTRRGVFVVLFREGFLRRSAGEHLLRAQMFADTRVHAAPFSLSNVRRMSACARGTL